MFKLHHCGGSVYRLSSEFGMVLFQQDKDQGIRILRGSLMMTAREVQQAASTAEKV